MKRSLAIILSLFIFVIPRAQQSIPPIGNIDFDEGWRFIKQDISQAQNPEYKDAGWRMLDLPHDWSIEDFEHKADDNGVGPFTKTSAGGPFTGHTAGGTGWYRKTFSIPFSVKGRNVSIHFEGIYMHSDVWINGHHLGNHPNGYTPVIYDLTPYLNAAGSKNTIAVRVCNEGKNSRWYSGSGIDRHVWLKTSAATHIAPLGIHITTPQISSGNARVRVVSNIQSPDQMKGQITIQATIRSADGKLVSSANQTIGSGEDEMTSVIQEMSVANPRLWSTDRPELYQLSIALKAANKLLDSSMISFGIRSIQMDATNGLLVNGKRTLLRGGCLHHDNGPLGAAAIDRADERRLQILKANGFNAIRTSHNPPSPHFLDLCDQLGFLVIDEAFDVWEHKKLFDDSTDYHHFFNEWGIRDLNDMVKRDRNHPSVLLWSIGNEINERAEPEGLAIARKLIGAIHQLDSTRGITEGVCWFWDHPGRPWDSLQPVFSLLDVSGYNYEFARYAEEHKKFPSRLIAGTETYAMDIFDDADLAEKNPWVLGEFIWTAWDYIGEAGIGHSLVQPDSIKQDKTMLQPWPWFNANCGDIDFIGNKKPQSYYRDVIYKKSKLEMLVEQPVVPGMKNLPNGWGWPSEIKSWTWPGQEGKNMMVSVYSQCTMVRLELNGRVIAEKNMSATDKWKTKFVLPYQPGLLKVTGYENGQPVATSSLSTSGKAVNIGLTADRQTISTGGKDLSYVMVDIRDAQGNWVPDGEHDVHFSVEGAGSLAAVANANPAGMQSFRKPVSKTFHGRCLLIIRSGKKNGKTTIRASADGMNTAQLIIESKAKQ